MRGQGPRRGRNQRQQNFSQRPRMNQQGPRMNQQGPIMNQQEQFHPRNIEHQQMEPRPQFPHEINIQQGQGGNQFRPLGPGGPPNQESLLGPGPPMMHIPRPLMDEAPGQNIHVNPRIFERIPGFEGFPGQPQPFNPGQFQPPPHSQVCNLYSTTNYSNTHMQYTGICTDVKIDNFQLKKKSYFCANHRLWVLNKALLTSNQNLCS